MKVCVHIIRLFKVYSLLLFQMAGPIWTGPLHDAAFVTQVLKTSVDLNLKNSRRITGMLAVILEELKDVPLYYTLTNLCSVLHCEVIPMQEFR
jgi:N2,N2-dimethylguanosine tRNA methyltransferase